MRRDHNSLRPRINKPGSQNDISQKQNNSYIDDINLDAKSSFSINEFDW